MQADTDIGLRSFMGVDSLLDSASERSVSGAEGEPPGGSAVRLNHQLECLRDLADVLRMSSVRDAAEESKIEKDMALGERGCLALDSEVQSLTHALREMEATLAETAADQAAATWELAALERYSAQQHRLLQTLEGLLPRPVDDERLPAAADVSDGGLYPLAHHVGEREAQLRSLEDDLLVSMAEYPPPAQAPSVRYSPWGLVESREDAAAPPRTCTPLAAAAASAVVTYLTTSQAEHLAELRARRAKRTGDHDNDAEVPTLPSGLHGHHVPDESVSAACFAALEALGGEPEKRSPPRNGERPEPVTGLWTLDRMIADGTAGYTCRRKDSVLSELVANLTTEHPQGSHVHREDATVRLATAAHVLHQRVLAAPPPALADFAATLTPVDVLALWAAAATAEDLTGVLGGHVAPLWDSATPSRSGSQPIFDELAGGVGGVHAHILHKPRTSPASTAYPRCYVPPPGGRPELHAFSTRIPSADTPVALPSAPPLGSPSLSPPRQRFVPPRRGLAFVTSADSDSTLCGAAVPPRGHAAASPSPSAPVIANDMGNIPGLSPPTPERAESSPSEGSQGEAWRLQERWGYLLAALGAVAWRWECWAQSQRQPPPRSPNPPGTPRQCPRPPALVRAPFPHPVDDIDAGTLPARPATPDTCVPDAIRTRAREVAEHSLPAVCPAVPTLGLPKGVVPAPGRCGVRELLENAMGVMEPQPFESPHVQETAYEREARLGALLVSGHTAEDIVAELTSTHSPPTNKSAAGEDVVWDARLAMSDHDQGSCGPPSTPERRLTSSHVSFPDALSNIPSQPSHRPRASSAPTGQPERRGSTGVVSDSEWAAREALSEGQSSRTQRAARIIPASVAERRRGARAAARLMLEQSRTRLSVTSPDSPFSSQNKSNTTTPTGRRGSVASASPLATRSPRASGWTPTQVSRRRRLADKLRRGEDFALPSDSPRVTPATRRLPKDSSDASFLLPSAASLPDSATNVPSRTNGDELLTFEDLVDRTTEDMRQSFDFNNILPAKRASLSATPTQCGSVVTARAEESTDSVPGTATAAIPAHGPALNLRVVQGSSKAWWRQIEAGEWVSALALAHGDPALLADPTDDDVASVAVNACDAADEDETVVVTVARCWALPGGEPAHPPGCPIHMLSHLNCTGPLFPPTALLRVERVDLVDVALRPRGTDDVPDIPHTPIRDALLGGSDAARGAAAGARKSREMPGCSRPMPGPAVRTAEYNAPSPVSSPAMDDLVPALAAGGDVEALATPLPPQRAAARAQQGPSKHVAGETTSRAEEAQALPPQALPPQATVRKPLPKLETVRRAKAPKKAATEKASTTTTGTIRSPHPSTAERMSRVAERVGSGAAAVRVRGQRTASTAKSLPVAPPRPAYVSPPSTLSTKKGRAVEASVPPPALAHAEELASDTRCATAVHGGEADDSASISASAAAASPFPTASLEEVRALQVAGAPDGATELPRKTTRPPPLSTVPSVSADVSVPSERDPSPQSTAMSLVGDWAGSPSYIARSPDASSRGASPSAVTRSRPGRSKGPVFSNHSPRSETASTVLGDWTGSPAFLAGSPVRGGLDFDDEAGDALEAVEEALTTAFGDSAAATTTLPRSPESKSPDVRVTAHTLRPEDPPPGGDATPVSRSSSDLSLPPKCDSLATPATTCVALETSTGSHTPTTTAAPAMSASAAPAEGALDGAATEGVCEDHDRGPEAYDPPPLTQVSKRVRVIRLAWWGPSGIGGRAPRVAEGRAAWRCERSDAIIAKVVGATTGRAVAGAAEVWRLRRGVLEDRLATLEKRLEELRGLAGRQGQAMCDVVMRNRVATKQKEHLEAVLAVAKADCVAASKEYAGLMAKDPQGRRQSLLRGNDLPAAMSRLKATVIDLHADSEQLRAVVSAIPVEHAASAMDASYEYVAALVEEAHGLQSPAARWTLQHPSVLPHISPHSSTARAVAAALKQLAACYDMAEGHGTPQAAASIAQNVDYLIDAYREVAQGAGALYF